MNPKGLLTKSLLELQANPDGLVDRLQLSSPLTDQEVGSLLQQQLHCSTVDLALENPAPEAISAIPYKTATELNAIPLSLHDGILTVAVVDPSDSDCFEGLRFLSGREIKLVVAPKQAILDKIETTYAEHQRSRADQFASKGDKRFVDLAGNTPVVELANTLISEAIHRRASDIHCEPGEELLRIRFRIDGMLQEILTIPFEQKAEFLSRLKIMSGMDIAEKRRPQDGRIQVETASNSQRKAPDHPASRIQHPGSNRTIDIRVSSLPTEHGEKIVLRILDKSNLSLTLDSLGLDPQRLEIFQKAVSMPHGIILLTGPTGSGKTTTLYAALNYIKHPGLNISTVEDPIEYNLDGINQTQVNPEIDLTFASALRTLLRQDPNVIMVGEIRDSQTAEIAVRAGLTGHLVLSTLHTNDAPTAVTRLVDMGLEPYLVSSTVNLMAAQRLVRRVCPHCHQEEKPSQRHVDMLGIEPTMCYTKGSGCSLCGNSGYRGRIGIYELLPVSDAIKGSIAARAPASEIRKLALAEGMRPLRLDGLDKAKAGLTTLDEVLRETASL